MTRSILTALILASLGAPALAQGYIPPRPLETLDQTHQRQQQNRFQQDRAFGGQPLGGYREPLGDSPVRPPSFGSPFGPPQGPVNPYAPPPSSSWR